MSDAAQPFSLAEYQGANLIRPSEMKTLAHEKCFLNRSHNARVFTFAGKRAPRGIFVKKVMQCIAEKGEFCKSNRHSMSHHKSPPKKASL